MKRVKCTVSFYYDPESYLFFETDENPPSDEEIFQRCKEMFVEDITDLTDPFLPEYVLAEFTDVPRNNDTVHTDTET